MSAFDNKKVYSFVRWEEVERRSFDASEIAQVERAKVTRGDYGLNCCFFMKGGGEIFFPFSKASVVVEGSEIDIRELDYIILEREGKRIERVEPK